MIVQDNIEIGNIERTIAAKSFNFGRSSDLFRNIYIKKWPINPPFPKNSSHIQTVSLSLQTSRQVTHTNRITQLRHPQFPTLLAPTSSPSIPSTNPKPHPHPIDFSNSPITSHPFTHTFSTIHTPLLSFSPQTGVLTTDVSSPLNGRSP
jgi:hypothetical protein